MSADTSDISSYSALTQLIMGVFVVFLLFLVKPGRNIKKIWLSYLFLAVLSFFWLEYKTVANLT
ncbi:hypothetical protein AYI77_05975 [Shewanella algae]|jgi:hypothetical protein|nr:hypothetical protein AYI77_05975 [Shewanella algae]